MPPIHRHLPAAITLASLFILAGCQTAPPPQKEAGEPQFVTTGGNTLAGYWRWVQTRSDGEIVRPTMPADSFVFRIGPYGNYREFADGKMREGRYWVAKGQLYAMRDSAYLVLMFDSSGFFSPSDHPLPAAAVRDLTSRTLVLSGTGTDATVHTFERVTLGR